MILNSVVVTAYNSSKYIAHALESIYEQTILPDEIILVDDASADVSELEVLVKAYAVRSEVPSIRLIQLDKNVGPGSARNVGYEHCTGKFVSFLDADDAWCTEKISYVMAAIEAKPHADVLFHRYAPKPENIPKNTESVPEFSEVDYRYYLSGNIHPPTVSVNRSRFPEFRFSDGRRYSEDFATFYLAMSVGRTFVLINRVLAHGYKAAIGEAGLSANVFRMHSGYISACLMLLQKVDHRAKMVLISMMILEYFKFPIRLFKLGYRRIDTSN
ncbi:glycosyltransferase [Paucibacter sp. B2R-40]|uniref:glycosyltransferase family 2 protein n=1 Tax=Paucibacter sp. B2R-40 TaxID=2893554 RepID=UPI0021E4BF93|nr:glycosyltransferase family 2 protein [Paucibacter sp. B2R-40]MCV2354534.1 glycosyltransferase [Paucibacter sp. B2R-40]